MIRHGIALKQIFILHLAATAQKKHCNKTATANHKHLIKWILDAQQKVGEIYF